MQFNTYGQGGFGDNSGSTHNVYEPKLDQPVCPRFDFEQVVPISQNKDKLVANIKKFQPRSGTSIFLGLKWCATLLDPSFQPVIGKLPNSAIDTPFATRPEPYDLNKLTVNKTRSLKYIVLMTDGFNDNSKRLLPEFYDDPSERLYWAHHNMAWATSSYNSSRGGPKINLSDYQAPGFFYSRADGNDYMRSMFDAAKTAGIVIYTILSRVMTHLQTQWPAVKKWLTVRLRPATSSPHPAQSWTRSLIG